MGLGLGLHEVLVDGREAEPKRAALAERRLDRDVTAHAFGELVDGGEADAGTREAARLKAAW